MITSRLVRDLETSIARGSTETSAEALRQVTDLFLRDARSLEEDHLGLFDVVLSRLNAAADTRARAELSERLADLDNAPRGIVRSLAHDEVVVARPVLQRSPRLDDEDLVSVARVKGRDHMLVMAERRSLAEAVTDVLLTTGDQVVIHAVAGNDLARLSERGVDALVTQAQWDEALQGVLGLRRDLPVHRARELAALARRNGRKRLVESMPAVPPDLVAGLGRDPLEPPTRDYTYALAVVSRRIEGAAIGELDVASFAAQGLIEEAVCAISYLTGVSIPSVEWLFRDTSADLLLILAKSQNWAWSTVRALTRLRGTPSGDVAALKRAFETYARLTVPTSQRVLRFLQVHEGQRGRTGAAVAGPAQVRTAVR